MLLKCKKKLFGDINSRVNFISEIYMLDKKYFFIKTFDTHDTTTEHIPSIEAGNIKSKIDMLSMNQEECGLPS